ncbi:MAG: hypothetical protein M3177_02445, partial [Pseudomonadota bacterium]|nr:hypothetical protein [Pseudomonadota bacterium]
MVSRSILLGAILIALASCVRTTVPPQRQPPPVPVEQPPVLPEQPPPPEPATALTAGVRPGSRLDRLR